MLKNLLLRMYSYLFESLGVDKGDLGVSARFLRLTNFHPQTRKALPITSGSVSPSSPGHILTIDIYEAPAILGV